MRRSRESLNTGKKQWAMSDRQQVFSFHLSDRLHLNAETQRQTFVQCGPLSCDTYSGACTRPCSNPLSRNCCGCRHSPRRWSARISSGPHRSANGAWRRGRGPSQAPGCTPLWGDSMHHHQATNAGHQHDVITAGLTCYIRLNTIWKHDELELSAACQRKSRVMYCSCALIKQRSAHLPLAQGKSTCCCASLSNYRLTEIQELKRFDDIWVVGKVPVKKKSKGSSETAIII